MDNSRRVTRGAATVEAARRRSGAAAARVQRDADAANAARNVENPILPARRVRFDNVSYHPRNITQYAQSIKSPAPSPYLKRNPANSCPPLRRGTRPRRPVNEPVVPVEVDDEMEDTVNDVDERMDIVEAESSRPVVEAPVVRKTTVQFESAVLNMETLNEIRNKLKILALDKAKQIANEKVVYGNMEKEFLELVEELFFEQELFTSVLPRLMEFFEPSKMNFVLSNVTHGTAYLKEQWKNLEAVVNTDVKYNLKD